MHSWVPDLYIGEDFEKSYDSKYGRCLIQNDVKVYYPYVYFYFVQNIDENGKFDGTWSYYTETTFKGIEEIELKNVDESGNIITNPYTARVPQLHEITDSNGDSGLVFINPSISLAAYVEMIE